MSDQEGISSPALARYVDEAPESGGVVYFVSDGSAIKIGHTTRSVSKRVAELQTGNPRVLTVVRTMPGPLELERAYHEMFAARLVRPGGEWFALHTWEVWGLDAPSVQVTAARRMSIGRLHVRTGDAFDAWFAERTVVDGSRTRATALFEDYLDWADDEDGALSQAAFGRRMSSVTRKRKSNGIWYEIGLRGDD